MSSHGALIDEYLTQLQQVLSRLDHPSLEQLVRQLVDLIQRRDTLYICGNGGSAANALHIANDFTYGIHPQGQAMKVEALTANTAILSCLGNDIGYSDIFAHQLKVKGKTGDILMVLSGSGNSDNIIKALQQATELGMKTIAILGFDGGKAKTMADLSLHCDINDMQISEDTQIIIGHLLMKMLHKELSHG